MTAQESNGEPVTRPGAAPSTRGSRRALLLGAIVGFGLVAIAAVVVAIATSDRLPPLTQADYDAASARWDKNKPASYQLDLDLRGNRPSKIHVEVRDGEIVHMIRDGVEPSQKRTWYYWSVDGQLDTIGQELEMARSPARSFGAEGAAQVVMWAEFDEHYGYPRRYRRAVMGTGADLQLDWVVTRFEPLNGP